MKVAKRVGWVAVGVLAAAGLLGACVEQPSDSIKLRVARPEPTKPAMDTKADPPLLAVDGRREGGSLVLGGYHGRVLAFVADEDAHALRMLDAQTHEELAVHRLPGRPAQVLLAGDGRLYVALRDKAMVQSLEVVGERHTAARLSLRAGAKLPTADEPIALAAPTRGNEILVVSGWGRRLQRFDLKSMARTADVSLPREPRAVTVSDDGKTAFVAHAAGSALTRVALDEADAPKTALWVGGSDAATHQRPQRPRRHRKIMPFLKGVGDGGGSPRHAVQGFALAHFEGDVFAPLVLAHPGERPVGGYGTSVGFSAHQPVLAVVGAADDEVRLRAANRVFDASHPRMGSAGAFGSDACFLPRAIAVAPQRRLLFVSCLGTDTVEAYQTKEQSLVRSMTGRWLVPPGPTGLAIDEDGGQALVWSQFSGMLSSFPLPGMPAEQTLSTTFAKLPTPVAAARITKLRPLVTSEGIAKLSASAMRGRELFHGAGDRRIAGDGRACASCHPDGREDGISWPSPQGRSQTPILAGRLAKEMAPFGWNGESETVAKHVTHTFKRLGGTGLTGADMEALMAYLREMPGPPRASVKRKDARVARGKALFETDAVGCAVCHKQGDGSDGATHEVGSGRKLDTPSLRYIAGSAPYFHDGRYATLGELLRETKGKMGWAPDMSDDDLEALEAYLTTL